MKSLFTTKQESESNAIEIFFFFVLTNYIKRKKNDWKFKFFIVFSFSSSGLSFIFYPCLIHQN